MKFRSKVVVIEAIQFTGKESVEMMKQHWPSFNQSLIGNDDDIEHVYIQTLEGAMKGKKTDWIIRGTQGEFYPCKDIVFKEKYETFNT